MAKNIVLLSDGTGNSAAKQFKSNVWRLYQALDIGPADADKPQQIVFYDDGVGTENLKPLAALGGAFGIGVWKNVKELYTFVCRNYQPGDQIYGFGFSRGAFTIRLLMGLIGRCGIVRGIPNSEARLLEGIENAYQAYRRDFLIRASRERGMIWHLILKEPRYASDSKLIGLPKEEFAQQRAEIRFLGVWDTVDAYGMPIDELKLAIDRWVYPMSVADRDVSPHVKTMRHALSLDDERPTFRPVLWNETVTDPVSKKEIRLGSDRIQQIWFAGVHSNVGGGYPDDGLAYAALDWMMGEAEAAGLRFLASPRQEIANRMDAHGEEYDSRSGIAGYYRYGPRRVDELCRDDQHNVTVPVVQVHSSVLDRIERRQRAYGPLSLNAPFAVAGGSSPASVQTFSADKPLLEQAWDLVWWRRLAYFATVALTAFVSLFVLRAAFDWPRHVLEATESRLAGLWAYVTAALNAIGIGGQLETGWQGLTKILTPVLPGWAPTLLGYLSAYPLSAVLAVGLLAWLFISVSPSLKERIALRAEWAWAPIKKLDASLAPPPTWHNSVAAVGRPITGRLYRAWRTLLVHVLGIAIGLVVVVPVMLVGLWRMAFGKHRAWLKS